jgi:hypothetical protein
MMMNLLVIQKTGHFFYQLDYYEILIKDYDQWTYATQHNIVQCVRL